MQESNFSQITIIINKALLQKLLNYLNELGINSLYSTFGRSVLLKEKKAFHYLINSPDITSEPVEVLHFYLPIECENIVMKSIVHHLKLDSPGRGSIFSKALSAQNNFFEEMICQVDTSSLQEILPDQTINLYPNLTQINCTLSKGNADNVAQLLLHLGVVPLITNASGTGLRDQLGILRITIPKDKELLSIVVGKQEANGITERIIQWAKLDRPGRGFIWQSPVEKGVINFKTSENTINYVASTEQIISAIDSLKGSFSWRQGNPSLSSNQTRSYFSGDEIFIQINEGMSQDISKVMKEVGIHGATIQQLKTLSSSHEKDNIVIPQEVIRIVATKSLSNKFCEELNKTINPLEDEKKIKIFISKVLKAFNYRQS